MEKRVRFTTEEESLLIDLVSKYPEIYDSTLPANKDLVLRERIWRDISRNVGVTEDACKRKWRCLRDAFIRIRRTLSMMSPSEAKEPKWTHYPKMLSFFDDSMTRAKFKKQTELKIEYNGDDSQSSDESDAMPSSNDGSIKKRKRKHTAIENDFTIQKQEESLMPSYSASDNTLDSFCHHMKNVLDSLPPVLQVKAKQEIYSVISKYELESVTANPLVGYTITTSLKDD